eukprot:UC1_evm2s1026
MATRAEAFKRDGYVVVRNFLSVAEVNEIRQNVSRFVSEVVPEAPKGTAMYEDPSRPESIKRLVNMFAHDAYFAELAEDRRFAELASQLLGEPARRENMQWFNKPAGLGTPTPPHQDGFYFMLEPNHALTMWLALDVADRENGCLFYLPGSNQKGMRPHAKSDVVGFSQGLASYTAEDVAAEVYVCAQPGDLLVHHCLTVHGAGPNVTAERHRAGLGLIYYAQAAKHDVERAKKYQQELYAQWQAEGKL